MSITATGICFYCGNPINFNGPFIHARILHRFKCGATRESDRPASRSQPPRLLPGYCTPVTAFTRSPAAQANKEKPYIFELLRKPAARASAPKTGVAGTGACCHY